MLHDLEQETPEPGERAEVCIVGAGAAGILLAVELSRQGKRVLLLEGGGADVEAASQDPYDSDLPGLHHNGVHVGRFRAHGGSTTRWGGQILELDELDFERRPWIAGSGWPFTRELLEPFYRRAIELEGLGDAELDDNAVWRQLGLQPPAFDGMEPFFSRWCPEPNFARLHREALTSSTNVEVWLHANAVSPVIENDRVLAVRCRTLSGREHLFHADRFVWAMGGIESCRFFLQPALAAMPWHRSGLLGRFFQDHLIAPSARLLVCDPKRFHQVFDNVFRRGFKYQPKLRLSRELQERHRTLNVAGMILAESASDQAAAELKTIAKDVLRGRERSPRQLARLLRDLPLLARMTYRYSVRQRAYVPPDAVLTLGVHCEQPPEGESSITLSPRQDALGMFRTALHWSVSDLEIHSIRVFTEVAAESLAGIAEVVPDPDLLGPEADNDRYRPKCGDGYHHMGGMRMAVSPAQGVVDLDLKLHGIANGYICSAAVFPTSGFSNPTHTVLALAVRLADHLART